MTTLLLLAVAAGLLLAAIRGVDRWVNHRISHHVNAALHRYRDEPMTRTHTDTTGLWR